VNSLGSGNYWSNDSTELEFWFACASMDWAACRRTLFFVYSVISFGMSASRIVLSEAVTFSYAVFRFV